MKAIKRYFLLLSIFLSYCSCSNRTAVKNERTIYIETKMTNGIKSFFSGYQSLVLETTPNNLISGIDKLQIGNDCLWILDKKQRTIYTFDHSGKYLWKLCKVGAGPDEYLDIADFQVINNDIYILSRSIRKINRYKDTGELVESYKLDDYYDYFHMSDNSILLYSNYSNGKLFNLIVYNSVLGIYEKEFLPFPSNKSFSFTPSPFNVSNANEILISQQYDYTLYQVSPCSVNNLVTLDFDSKDVLPENVFERDFYDVYKELQAMSVVKRIDYINKEQNIIDIIYTLDYQPWLTRIDLETGDNKTLKLEFNEEIPYIFAKAIGFEKGSLVTYLSASDVLMFDKGFIADEHTDRILNLEDNPVLFFNNLKYD